MLLKSSINISISFHLETHFGSTLWLNSCFVFLVHGIRYLLVSYFSVSSLGSVAPWYRYDIVMILPRYVMSCHDIGYVMSCHCHAMISGMWCHAIVMPWYRMYVVCSDIIIELSWCCHASRCHAMISLQCLFNFSCIVIKFIQLIVDCSTAFYWDQ